MSRTPVTDKGLTRFDHLPPLEAAWRAWREPGTHPMAHLIAQYKIDDLMPLLARALRRAEPASVVDSRDKTV